MTRVIMLTILVAMWWRTSEAMRSPSRDFFGGSRWTSDFKSTTAMAMGSLRR